MKKVITIVLALVMVFAIAAPAMAMTDAPLVPPTAPSTEWFEVSAQLISNASASYGAALVLPTVDANKAYVANELFGYVVYVAIKPAYTTAVGAGNAAAVGSMIKVTFNGLSFDTPSYVYGFKTNAWAPITAPASVPAFNSVANAAGNRIGYWCAASDPAFTGYSKVAFVGSGVVTGAVAEPSFTVFAGMSAMADGVDYVAAKLNGNNVYIQKSAARSYTVATAGKNVTFTMNAAGKCVAINVYDGATNYAVTTGTYVDATGAYVTDFLFNGAANATLKAFFTSIMNYLGFDYAKIDTNAVPESAFLAKINASGATATVAVPLYTAAIVVPGSQEIEPPKTGDAASTLGFVMIAAAIVAAAALAYKKVRA